MPDWDDIFSKRGRVFVRPHHDMENVKDLILSQTSTTPKVLDLGCGTGRHLLFFAKEGFEMYGLDGSPKAIELSKKWLSKKDLSATLTCQKIEDPFPYEDKFFDAIISTKAMHHNLMKEILITIKEMERVIKPNGIIFITFPFFKKFGGKKAWKMQKVEKRTYIPLDGPEKGLPHHFFTPKEINKVFKSFDIRELYIDKSNNRAIIGSKT